MVELKSMLRVINRSVGRAIVRFVAAMAFAVSTCDAAWIDVSDSVSVQRSRPLYNFATKTSYFDAWLVNGPQERSGELQLVIDSVTPSDVEVSNADGVTEDGFPFFAYDGLLADQTSGKRRIELSNPRRQRFAYTTQVRSLDANQAPVADAGPDQTAYVGDLVQLDGGASSDAEGDLLDYFWNFLTRPAGSLATLSDPNAVGPSFVLDVPGDYAIQLVVSDGLSDSAPDVVAVSTLNSSPVARAGSDQSVFVGDLVTLDGSASSDADGDTLTYQWSFESVPPGSGAFLTDATGTRPTFEVDLAGDYELQLVVNDGFEDSSPDTVRVSTQNSAPIARAGDDQSAFLGDTIMLDGSLSSDVDGDLLTYRWSLISIPLGSVATLSNSAAVAPTFEIDQPGAYVAQLIVNDGVLDSTPDTVTVSTENSPPVAEAGPDQSAFVGDNVMLDGSASFDADGDALFFTWSLVGKPAGSAAALSDPSRIDPGFTIDLPGDYVVQLVVNDGTADSTPDSVTISTLNSRPVADAGPDQEGGVGEAMALDGTGSFDADGDLLDFAWSLLSRPVTSGALIENADLAVASLTPDVDGDYVVQLIVHDGELESTPDTAMLSISPVVVNDPPVITSAPITIAQVGALYGYAVQASDPNGDTLAFSLDEAPIGMDMDAVDGSISWTPTADQTGDFPVIVRVTDTGGLFATQSYSISVPGFGAHAPDLLPPGDRSIPVAQAFFAQLFAVDLDPGDTRTFSLISGPAGLTVSETGVLQWTPDVSALGSHPVEVSVRDGADQSDSETFSIDVYEPVLPSAVNTPPVLLVPGEQPLLVGTALSLTVAGSDADGDSIEFAFANAPAGMTIDPLTGAIAWTPDVTAVGRHDVVIKLTDVRGAADFGSFVVEVSAVNGAPVAADDAYTVRLGDTLTVPAPGVLRNDSDPDDDPLTAALHNPPQKGTLNLAADGGFEYTPDVPVIEIGLAQQCVYYDRGGFAEGTAVGDIDGDGDVEMVSVLRPATGPEVAIVDGATCAAEVVLLGGGEDIGEGDPEATVTLVNLDDDADLEIVVPYSRWNPNAGADFSSNEAAYLMAVNRDGTPVWNTPTRLSDPVSYVRDSSVAPRTVGPVPVDLDGDGDVELLQAWIADSTIINTVRAAVVAYEGRTGAVRWEYVGPPQRTFGTGVPARSPIVADLDLDGKIEIIWNHSVLNADGTLKFLLPVDEFTTGVANMLVAAVANFDDDPYAEIVAYDPFNHYVFEHDGTLKWKIERDMGSVSGSVRAYSLITVAQLDDDSPPEYVVMRRGTGTVAWALYAYDTDGSELWNQFDLGLSIENQELSAVAPAAFDFDRDGIDEIVLQHPGGEGGSLPEPGLYILSGEDGSIIAQDPTGLLPGRPAEPVTIADIDGDGAAEIIGSHVYPSGGGGELRVFEGLPGNPFPAARPIRNHSNYQPTHVNADGSIPTYIRPHWLIPGLNKFFATPIIPGEDGVEADTFSYVANDGELDSNEATVTIELTTFGAPEIVSQPILGASPGFAYEYGALAIDPDVGDELTWALVDGPDGMTMDRFGIVRWTPAAADLGTNRVQIVVTDSNGNNDSQIFNVNVEGAAEVPSVIGQDQATAESTIAGVGLVTGAVRERFDPAVAVGLVAAQDPVAGTVAPAGASVSITLSLGPSPADIDDDGDGFSENQGDCADDDPSRFPGAVDSPGDDIDQNCDGADATLPIVDLVIEPAISEVLTGQTVRHAATGIFDNGTSQSITDLAAWTNGPVFSSGVAGSFEVSASRDGVTATATVNVRDRVPGDDTPPLAEITGPEGNATITAPTDIVGTASDANLLKYELAYAVAGSDDFTTFASSTTPVTDGVLGQFDPSLLINDLYTIRLTAYDRGGNITIDETTVQVDGDLKVGNFTLRFADLTIPMSGIPITVTRTYDSREQRSGDFGYGWSLDVNTLRLSTSRVLGTGWEVLKSGLAYRLVPTDAHTVSVTMPDGHVEQFDMVVAPSNSAIVPFPPLTQSVRYQPRPGTLGQLASLDENFVSILDPQPGVIDLRRDSDGRVYEPQRFRYTAADGTRIDIHKTSGVERIVDPNGNTLTFSENGITHSAGKSVVFDRDVQGRITRITDPVGNVRSYDYDANGDLRSHTDGEGNATQFTYDWRHGLIEIVDPLGRPLARNEYDDDGRLVRSTTADGRVIDFAHDIGARQEVLTEADGSVTVMEYDERGNILRTTDPLGRVTTNTYDADDNLLGTTDPLGNTITQTFDARRNRLTVTNALGHTTTLAYNDQDHVTSITDPLGRTTRFAYDARGNRISVTDALGNVTAHAYDARGSRIATTDALGNTIQLEYSAAGNLEVRTDALGNSETLSYDANSRLIGDTNRLGHRSVLRLDARGLSVGGDDPAGRSMTFVWNAAGKLETVIDPAGAATQQALNAAGKEIAFTDASGQRTERTYDLRGRLASIVDPLGRTTSFGYDAAGQRTNATSPDGGVNQTRYDAVGRIAELEDALGRIMRYEYDAAGRNTKVIDPLGNETRYAYDAVGNQISMTDARGNVFEYAYDVLGRKVRTTFPDGSFIETGYDAVGRVISETDALGRTTTYAYDANSNLVQVTDPAGAQTRFVYDAEDKLVSQTDARGHVTTFAYDVNGRQIAKTYPDGTTETQSYDLAGNVASQTDPNGDTTVLAYDANGRLTRKVFADGSEETYTHSATGRTLVAGNANGDVTFEYDLNDRLTGLENPDGSAIAYTYDLAGNRTSDTIRSALGAPARTTHYTYDDLNRIETVTDPDGQIITYGYDANGNLASIDYPNGVTSTFAYDSNNRLEVLTHSNATSTLARYAYDVNAVGDRTRVTEMNGSWVDYAYDDMRRLVRESHFDSSGVKQFELLYEYDLVGNRTALIDIRGDRTVLSYDAADKLLAAGGDTFDYDANGNLRSRNGAGGLTAYQYDRENQLVGASTPLADIAYAYDANGERVRRDDGVAATRYLVDPVSTTGYSQVLADYEAGGIAAQYVFGSGLLSRHDAAQSQFFHSDASRNVRLLTDDAGQTSDSYRYSAFGEVIERTGGTANPHTFAGERYDSATSLTYLRARYYDPSTGRFVSRDPFGGMLRDPVSLHRYLYSHANPVAFSDPSGLVTLAEVKVSTFIGATVGGISSYISARLAGKKGLALISETIIGAAFGAIGGAYGTALSKAFAESKMIMTLLRNPAVAKFAGRLVYAIPVTFLNFLEDLSKGLSSGEAQEKGWDYAWSLAEVTAANLFVNALLGPGLSTAGVGDDAVAAAGPTGRFAIEGAQGTLEIFGDAAQRSRAIRTAALVEGTKLGIGDGTGLRILRHVGGEAWKALEDAPKKYLEEAIGALLTFSWEMTKLFVSVAPDRAYGNIK